MLIHKRFNYRVYPNKSTISRLDRWNSALKWLWNLANEQRRNGYARPNGEKIYPSYFKQSSELTDLRKIAPWIKDVPRHVAESRLNNLDLAWQHCFDKISSTPKWKRKTDYLSFHEHAPSLEGSVRLPLSSLNRDFFADRKQAIVIYCQKGHRSRALLKELHAKGFDHVIGLKGGLEAVHKAEM